MRKVDHVRLPESPSLSASSITALLSDQSGHFNSHLSNLLPISARLSVQVLSDIVFQSSAK